MRKGWVYEGHRLEEPPYYQRFSEDNISDGQRIESTSFGLSRKIQPVLKKNGGEAAVSPKMSRGSLFPYPADYERQHFNNALLPFSIRRYYGKNLRVGQAFCYFNIINLLPPNSPLNFILFWRAVQNFS